MSTGGVAARRVRLAPTLVSCVLLGACASESDADLQARIEELQQENAELREQLAARPPGTVVARPDTSDGASEPAPSPSTSPTASTTTAEPAPARGSRERPMPVGRPIPAGDWVYTVLAFEPNVDEIVAQLDPENPPAGESQVYARLRVRAEYRGEGAGSPRRLTINLVSPAGKSIGEIEVCCKPGRDALGDQAETFRGGSVEGWIYYAVAAADAFGGKFLAFDPDGEFPGVEGGIGFFAVN